MTRYLISFDCDAMTFPDEDLPDVAKAAPELVEQAKDAGVCVFGGGVHGHAASGVATDGSVTFHTDHGDQGVHRRIAVLAVPSHGLR